MAIQGFGIKLYKKVKTLTCSSHSSEIKNMIEETDMLEETDMNVALKKALKYLSRS